MLTNERIDNFIETKTGYVPEPELRSLCRAIEAEVLAEAQEPVAEVRWAADIPNGILEIDMIKGMTPPVGTKFYAAPASCPKCATLQSDGEINTWARDLIDAAVITARGDRNADFEQCSTMLNNAEREIEALQSKIAELEDSVREVEGQRNSSDKKIGEQAALIEKCERALRDLSGMGFADEALAAIAKHKERI